MKGKIIISLLLVAFTFCLANSAYANCGMCGVKSTAKEGEVINDTCPVMDGNKVAKDTQYKTVYKGKTIGFCCPDCIEKFKADPEKYMAKLKKGKKCMIKCPECGAEIDVKAECKKQGCPMMKEGEHKGHTH